MIDWMTLHIDTEHLSKLVVEQLSGISDKIMRIKPDGEISWCTATFQSLRSDTNGLSYSFTGLKLTIAGSPASVRNPNNVFGSDDLQTCFSHMISFFSQHTGIFIPFTANLYRCTRIDYTRNLFVGSQANVNICLDTLKNTSTRGDNVEKKHSTIYWNKSSKLRCGKLYNKYLHAKKCNKDNTHFYSEDELKMTESIVRSELKLGRIWFNRLEKPWFMLTTQDLQKEHDSFFSNIIGSVEVTNMHDLLNRLNKISPSENQALAAFRTYQLIQSIGYKQTVQGMPKTTWYRHRKQLLDAGLCKTDLQVGQIVPFRRTEVIEMVPVNSWAELKLLQQAG